MHSDSDLHELVPIAVGFLRASGLKAAFFEDEDSARDAVDRESANGSWPVLTTPLDTDGEKEHEVFLGSGENADEIGLTALLAVKQSGVEAHRLAATLEELTTLIAEATRQTSKDELAEIIRAVVPEFRHVRSGRSLDHRM
jgi:hypothetical protein